MINEEEFEALIDLYMSLIPDDLNPPFRMARPHIRIKWARGPRDEDCLIIRDALTIEHHYFLDDLVQTGLEAKVRELAANLPEALFDEVIPYEEWGCTPPEPPEPRPASW